MVHKQLRTQWVRVGLALAAATLLRLGWANPVQAQDDSLQVVRYLVDGGGGMSQAGEYSLLGVAGQPAAGASAGGGFTLVGGFLAGAEGASAPTEDGHSLYLPQLRRVP